MHPLVKLTTGLLCLATLSGCLSTAPSKPMERDPNNSLALDIAIAGRLGSHLRDAEVPEKAYRKMSSGIIDTAYVAQGFFNPLVGMSSGMNGFGNLLIILTEDQTVNEKRHQLLAWMPKELAKDSDQATELMHSMLRNAALKSLNELGYSEVKGQSAYNYSSWVGKTTETIYINGKDCSPKNTVCKLVIYVSEPGEDIPPNFVSTASVDTWQWRNRNGAEMYFFKSINQETQYFINELKFYNEAIRDLPKWVYYYVSPGMHQPGSTWTPDMKLPVYKYPFILNQGKMHLFIKPQLAQR